MNHYSTSIDWAVPIFQNHFKAVFPELFFVTAITIILLFAVLYNPSKTHQFPILTKVVGWLSIQTLLITLLLSANNWVHSNHVGFLGTSGHSPQCLPSTNSTTIFSGALLMDDFTMVVKCIILLSAISSIWISFDYIKRQKINSFEYIILILFSTLGMLFIVSSYDLISMYLAIELQSLSFYVIAAFQRNDEFSVEAGLKYFILGALSSGLLLFGESIVYGFTGITNFEELTKLFVPTFFFQQHLVAESEGIQGIIHQASDLATASCSNNEAHNAIIIGLLFMLVAFLFKIGAVPFHMWTPDVYEGAPTSVTAFFAITPKIAILSLLLRLCLYTFYDLIESWQQIIIVCSFLSMFVGTLGAINQKKIKRLFAYSSIAHVGYLLIGLATGTIEAVESILIYIIIYILMIINVFGIILTMSKQNSNWAEAFAFGGWNNQPQFLVHRLDPFQSPKKPAKKDVGGFIQGYTEALGNSNNSGDLENSLCLPFPVVADWAPLPNEVGGLPTEVGRPRPRTHAGYEGRGRAKTQTGSPKTWSWESKFLKAGGPLWDPYKSVQLGPKPLLVFLGVGGLPIPGPLPKTGGRKARIPSPINSLTRIKPKCEHVKYLTDLSSLSKTNPILASTFAIILFSNAGIPPLAGFYGKLNVFLAAVEGSMYLLAIAGILCSAMGAFYSIRLIKIVYFHRIDQRIWHLYMPISKENSIMLGFTFFFTLFFFLYPSFLFITAHSAALSLCL